VREEGTILPHQQRAFAEVSKGYTRFRNDDVIFAKITPCMENGKIAIASGLHNGIGCGSTEFHVLRSRGSILSSYLWRFLRQSEFRQLAERHMTGAVGQRRVPVEFLRDTDIPLAPIAEQGRIVAKLDGITAHIAGARANLERIPRLIERYKHAVLDAAFRGKLTSDWVPSANITNTNLAVTLEAEANTPRRRRRLTEGFTNRIGIEFPELPSGWQYRSVGDLLESGCLADFGDGNHGSDYPRKSEFGESGIVYVTASQIRDGIVHFEECARLNADKASHLRKGWAQTGDVLLTHNATVGRTAIVDRPVERFLLGTSVTYYRARQRRLWDRYLYWALSSPIFQDQLVAVMGQTTRNQVPITRQADLQIPIAPIAEQMEVARKIDTAFSWLDKVVAEHARAMHLLPRLDQAILTHAFRGDLVPQDPNDEPASVLLERIRAGGSSSQSSVNKLRSSAFSP
jgi:type I restriction enzyme S subunit